MKLGINMKILFIYVANLHNEPYNYLDHKMNPAEFYLPKAGILSLIASLRQEFPNFCYKAIDILNPAHRAMPDEELEYGIVNTMSEEDIRDEVSSFEPDIVGLSCLSTHAPYLPKIIKIIKEIKRDTICILGGPFATSSPRNAILTEGIDFIIYGEGEISTCNFVRTLLNGGDFRKIRGIGFMQHDNIILTPPQPFIENLDTLPFPAWDLCHLENYSKVHRFLGSGVQHSDKTYYANIVSSRGCPYRCIFCHNIMGSKFRYRSAQNIVDEMVYLHDEFNVEEFTFSDDVFNLHQDRVEEFCRLLLKANRNIKFGFITNGLRGDILSEDLIDLLCEAGMRTAAIAIESASSRIQKKIRKSLDLEKIRQNINYMCQKGVYLATYNMIGFPTETQREIKETLEFNISLPHHLLVAHAVTLHEGTELYNMIVSEGVVPPDKSMGKLYWQPDEIDDSFREAPSSFLQVMLIKFITEFNLTKKRLNVHLEVMDLNRDNPFFIASVKRFYRNTWRIYSKAVPRNRREEINKLLNRLLNFQSQNS